MFNQAMAVGFGFYQGMPMGFVFYQGTAKGFGLSFYQDMAVGFNPRKRGVISNQPPCITSQ
jgi:hypothetical protein